MDILERVNNYIEDKHLLNKTDVVIVGFSGGPDSVALFLILQELGYKCVLAHCNFHLRGEESNRDQQFVEMFAQNKGVELRTTHFNTEEYAKQNGISLEMAARELRYNWFDVLQRDTKAQAVAIAHHSDDSIETFFINLLRGTGINGLVGIKTKNDKIVRPLLCLCRKEILSYLSLKGEEYVTDSTNLECDFLRNKIRNVLMPCLSEISPDYKQGILTSISHLRKNLAIYSSKIEEIRGLVVSRRENSIVFDLSVVWNWEERETILFELLKPYGCNIQMIQSILKCDLKSSGQSFQTKTHTILKNRKELEITSGDSTFDEVIIDCPGEFDLNGNKLLLEEINLSGLNIIKNKMHCYIDADKISFPMRIRDWKNGDYFHPFGMNKKKKLSDFFVNEKLSLNKKKSIRIIETNDRNIVWIVGIRADNRYRIDENTKKVLHFSLEVV